LRAIMAATRQKAHGSSIAARHQAKTIVFDFVKPTWPERRVSGSGGQAGLNKALAGRTQTQHRHELTNTVTHTISQPKSLQEYLADLRTTGLERCCYMKAQGCEHGLDHCTEWSRPFARTKPNEDAGTETNEDDNVQKPCTFGGYFRPCGKRREDQSCDQVTQGVGTLWRHRVNDK
jgi:hypothetical protein